MHPITTPQSNAPINPDVIITVSTDLCSHVCYLKHTRFNQLKKEKRVVEKSMGFLAHSLRAVQSLLASNCQRLVRLQDILFGICTLARLRSILAVQ